MLRVLVVASALSAAAAFSPIATLPRTAARSSVRMQLSKSERAIPFDWGAPPASLPSNIPGYTGFDPLGISTLVPIKYLQESEIKHGRAAMLATLGSVVQDVAVDPGYAKIVGGAKLTAAHDAFIQAANAGNKNAWALQQIFFWIGLFEFITFPAISETLNGGSREPGEFSFDPLGFYKPNDKARLQLAEIKNGRLAMLAIGGIVHHYFITGKGPVQLLTGA